MQTASKKILSFDSARKFNTFGSPEVEMAIQRLKDAIKYGFNALVIGETGTGKSSLVRKVAADFPNRSFVEVNMGSICASLFESELFGHRRGSFTGADCSRPGFFREDGGSILFLDEVGDLPLDQQPKILTATGDGYFTRVGENSKRNFNGVCIFATNQDLETMIKKGRFRADLYYRISECVIELPPLRQRLTSFPQIAYQILHDLNRLFEGKGRKRLSDSALSCLMAHDWPGNLRELKTILSRVFLSCPHELIEADDLEISSSPKIFCDSREASSAKERNERTSTIYDQERALIIEALDRNYWVQKNAAKELGVSPRALNYKINVYGITHPNWRRNKGSVCK